MRHICIRNVKVYYVYFQSKLSVHDTQTVLYRADGIHILYLRVDVRGIRYSEKSLQIS